MLSLNLGIVRARATRVSDMDGMEEDGRDEE